MMPEFEKEVTTGRIYWTLHKARKDYYHQCKFCPEPIMAGEQYYTGVVGGSGLGFIKFPYRAHAECVMKEVERLSVEEDIALAEAGIEEYAEGLKKENGLSI